MAFKKIYKISLCLFLIITSYCIAENFLASTSIKRRSVGQLKQDVAEVLVSILHQECRLIELKARTQQEICNIVARLANSDKNLPISKLSKPELENCLQQLKLVKDNNDRSLKSTENFLNFVHVGCIEKSTEKKS